MAKLLIEIYTEEIPYSLQKQLILDIKQLFLKVLINLCIKIDVNQVNVNATANRLAVFITGLPNKTPDKTTDFKGPNIKANELAISGFLKQHNIKTEDCIVSENLKGSFYIYQQHKKGGELVQDLPDIINEVLLGISFKKSMSWNSSNVKWARPIRSLLGLFENDRGVTDIIPFKYAGLNADNKLFTHKVMGKQNIIIKNISEYYEILADNFVLLNEQERIDCINVELQKIITDNGFSSDINSKLINEIAYLVEYPVILQAKIAKKYMKLPKELLINIIEKNQRYITFQKKDGSLADKIVIVANLKTADDGKTIIVGNEKVLNARLEDGLFFYSNDLKTTLLQKSEKLKNVSFFENIGTLFEKTIRIKKLFKEVFQEEQDVLSSVYKADLVSESVIESPELQGVMGSYYALHDGLSANIATAIADHYKPIAQNGALPSTELGAKLAVLDKLDTLISLFAHNQIPTGSKDPYALRRATLGIIKIVIEFKLDIKLAKFINPNLQEFITDRLLSYLKSLPLDFNITSTQVAKSKDNLNIYQTYQNIILIDSLLKTDDGVIFLQMLKRLEHIVLSQKDYTLIEIDSEILFEDIEKKLYSAFTQLNLLLKNNEKEIPRNILMQQCVVIAPLLEEFFKKIIINKSSNLNIKNNRVSLLYGLQQLLQNIL